MTIPPFEIEYETDVISGSKRLRPGWKIETFKDINVEYDSSLVSRIEEFISKLKSLFCSHNFVPGSDPVLDLVYCNKCYKSWYGVPEKKMEKMLKKSFSNFL